VSRSHEHVKLPASNHDGLVRDVQSLCRTLSCCQRYQRTEPIACVALKHLPGDSQEVCRLLLDVCLPMILVRVSGNNRRKKTEDRELLPFVHDLAWTKGGDQRSV
jgi:hypothetical protein